MGRGGSGGGGGGSSHSSSGFSSSRSSGGFSSSSHRSGSSGRSGSSRPSSGSSFGSSFGSFRPSSFYRPFRNYGSSSYRNTFINFGGGSSRSRSNNSGDPGFGGLVMGMLKIVMFIVIMTVVANVATQLATRGSALLVGSISSGGIGTSTVNRDRLESGYGFVMDCIDDETGEINSERDVANGMQKFYNKTGVQPYVWIKAYDSEVDPARLSMDDRCELSDTYYEDNIENEAGFLLVFFEDSAGDIYLDYTVYTVGMQADSVMDSEACGILEDYCKSFWYNDSLSTDEVIAKTFEKTGNRIMTKSTTGMDVMKIGVIIALVVVVAFVVIKLLKIRRAHEKARNEETARILNTPLGHDDDPTLGKYE